MGEDKKKQSEECEVQKGPDVVGGERTMQKEKEEMRIGEKGDHCCNEWTWLKDR